MIWNRGGVSIRGGRGKEEHTQKLLAELTGIAQHHISKMENGKRHFGKEKAKKLAVALNVDYRVFCKQQTLFVTHLPLDATSGLHSFMPMVDPTASSFFIQIGR
jgi:transcriptional regulator with XRE-family HTH domain